MTSKPDTPCSQCGRLMWWHAGNGTPKGEGICHPCRRKAKGRAPAERALKRSWEPQSRECPICGVVFTQDKPNQVYCTAVCRGSRNNWRRMDNKVATAEERGYGEAHRQERERWKPAVEAGQVDCCICGYWIEPGSEWHLDHTEDRTAYRGAAHADCNRRDGASRGARRANAQRRIEKTCDTCHSLFVTPYPRQRYCSRECKPKPQYKPAPPRPARHCADCGTRIKQGKRCPPCSVEYGRATMRNRYRAQVGIPLDAPVRQYRRRAS